MSIKSKVFGLVGVGALGMALTTGFATASTDSITTSVQVTCPQPMTVDVGGNATFDPILDSINDHDTSTAPGAITVTVDMGCYWGPWQVNAKTTNFVAVGNPFLWFGANHLSLQDATVETYAAEPIDPFSILEPEASNAYFSGPTDYDTILETAQTWIWFPYIPGPDIPAPFVTEASYTGVLSGLPTALPSGTYQSTLTVVLTAD